MKSVDPELLDRAIEWAERTARYATERVEAARVARRISARHPNHEASAWRAADLTEFALRAHRVAIEARNAVRRIRALDELDGRTPSRRTALEARPVEAVVWTDETAWGDQHAA